MEKIYIIVSFLFLMGTELMAQVQMGINFQSGIPVDEFRQNTNAIGWGGAIDVLVPLGGQESVLFAGGSIGYQLYGYESKEELLQANIMLNNTLIDVLEVPLEINTTNSIVNAHFVMRAKAPFQKVQPYIQGLVGARYISTRTRIRDDSDNFLLSNEDNRTIDAKTNLDDFIFSYGAGGGVMFLLTDMLYLNLGADLLRGSKASYYDASDTEQWRIEFTQGSNPEDFSSDDLQIEALPKRSKTDMLNINLGISVLF